MNAYFTVEEANLICAFEKDDRPGLIAEMRGSLELSEEPEMTEITQSCIERLAAMSDSGYEELELVPDYDDEEEEE